MYDAKVVDCIHLIGGLSPERMKNETPRTQLQIECSQS